MNEEELRAFYRARAAEVVAKAPPMCEESRRRIHALLVRAKLDEQRSAKRARAAARGRNLGDGQRPKGWG